MSSSGPTPDVVLADDAAPGVAPAAGLDLDVRPPAAALRRAMPVAASIAQVGAVAHRGRRPDRRRPARRSAPACAQATWLRARPVARLAGDVELGPRGVVRSVVCVVALADVRRVALGAHVVPVLAMPVQWRRSPGGDGLVRVEVEPALSALGLARARVPGERQGLPAAVRAAPRGTAGADGRRRCRRPRSRASFPSGPSRADDELAVTASRRWT